jgi:hypothetical protein
MSDIAQLAVWVESLTKIIGLPALIAGGLAALWQLILRWQAARVEQHTRLLEHFTDLMKVAHARAEKAGEPPIGAASQDAAIAGIWQLGRKHKVLRPVAIQGLKTVCEFKKDVAQPYLDDLLSSTCKSDLPPGLRGGGVTRTP